MTWRACIVSALTVACIKPAPLPASHPASTEVIGMTKNQGSGIELPSTEAILSAGFCNDDGQIAHINPIALPDNRFIYELNCAMYAYQGRYEYAWNDLKPVFDEQGLPMRLLGLPYRDKGVIELKWTEKARGIGDCGDWYWYVFGDNRFQLKEHRRRKCNDTVEITPELLDGSKWPLLKPQAFTLPK